MGRRERAREEKDVPGKGGGKKTGKRQMQKREIYCGARMEHIKKRLKGLEREK